MGADIRSSDLSYADLTEANLTGAVVWGTRLSNTALQGATIRNVRGWICLGSRENPLPSDEQISTIRENAREATKHSASLFLAQLTICLYGALTILSVEDAEFLGSVASIKLPVVDVSVRTSVFFTALPLILLVIQIYYLFYFRVTRKLWRTIEAMIRQTNHLGNPGDRRIELLRYPWIDLLVYQTDLASRIAAIPFLSLSWTTTPFLLWIAWIKTAPFRSTIALWVRDGAPASYLFGILFYVVLAFLALWAVLEESIERGVIEVRRVAIVVLGLCAVFLATERTVDSYSHQHRIQLVNAEISRRPGRENQDPRGAILPDVQLPGAKGRRAYLALANLNRSNFRDANLFGADLQESYLIDAVLTGANLHEAHASGANASGGVFRGAFLGASDWTRAQLICADFRGAKMKGVNFTGANLGAAKLVGTLLENAKFENADLRHADLSGSFAGGAQFAGAIYDDTTQFPEGRIPPEARRSTEPSPSYLCDRGNDSVRSGEALSR